MKPHQKLAVLGFRRYGFGECFSVSDDRAHDLVSVKMRLGGRKRSKEVQQNQFVPPGDLRLHVI